MLFYLLVFASFCKSVNYGIVVPHCMLIQYDTIRYNTIRYDTIGACFLPVAHHNLTIVLTHQFFFFCCNLK